MQLLVMGRQPPEVSQLKYQSTDHSGGIRVRHHLTHLPGYHFAYALVAAVALVAACQELSTAPSNSPGPAASAGGGSNAPSDTGGVTPPVTGATAITLAVTVGTAVPGPDTLEYAPLANAKVSVLRQTFTRGPGTGADTLTTSETVVASGTTDANGVATFQNLASASYRVEAVAAAGGQGASVWIVPPYAANVAATIVIRGRS
jgi:hypothetical protein